MKPAFMREGTKFFILASIVVACFAASFGYMRSAHGGVFDFQWALTHGPVSKRIYIEVKDIRAVCYEVGVKIEAVGCSQRVYSLDTCYVYLPLGAADWIRQHENKHCEGYTHL